MLKFIPCAVAAVMLCLCAPALASGPYEPNDSITTATPLIGGQDYNAAIETATDQDLFALYIVGSEPLDITVTNTNPAAGNADCVEPVIFGALDAADGTPVATVNGNDTVLLPSTSWDIVQTLNTGRYILKVVGGCWNIGLGASGGTFSVRVDPATAVTTATCFNADRLFRLAVKAYANAQHRYRLSHGPANRRRLARVVRAKRQALLHAQTQHSKACS
ncbi:MAG: hypothetical protein ACXVE9_18555 [Solirubrobacteraceae bacterium]